MLSKVNFDAGPTVVWAFHIPLLFETAPRQFQTRQSPFH